MTIISWNCNMAFRKKWMLVMDHQPDIIVVQECEHQEKLLEELSAASPSAILWFGDNRNKGMAVIAFNGYQLQCHKNYAPAYKMIVPIRVKKDEQQLMLFAVWANNPADPDGQYVTQVWKAIHYYQRLIRKTNTILIGDFNSNTIWDKPRRNGNHSDVVKVLQRKGIESVYHVYHQQQQGKEKHPTLFLYRHEDKPYHLDYCFVSKDLLEQLQYVEIGTHQSWCTFSDHTPIIARFKKE
ncbi:MAG: endonuclease/exonuclease/phosphatase family protein [Bacteroidetes bacterium]|nr:endonuclease/exonuclease/phosphatase family protein [Bacteroidota bacterium]